MSKSQQNFRGRFLLACLLILTSGAPSVVLGYGEVAAPTAEGTLTAWHPVFVHFAVALSVVAILFDLFGSWLQKEIWQGAGRLNLLWGVAAMGLAVLSGWWEHELPHSHGVFEKEVDELLAYHEYLGFTLLGFFVLLLLWRLRLRGRFPALLVVLYLVGAAGITVQGYIGGEMVYRYGAGVKAMEVAVAKEKPAPEHGAREEETSHQH